MGSQGRQEQTLLTDQDNAIIYEDSDPALAKDPAAPDPARYFLTLGEKVCRLLDEGGYALCLGEVMASNPKWCKPLSQWKESFSEWIMKAEPQELLDVSISLDFRPVFGETHLARELQEHIFTKLRGQTAFSVASGQERPALQGTGQTARQIHQTGRPRGRGPADSTSRKC